MANMTEKKNAQVKWNDLFFILFLDFSLTKNNAKFHCLLVHTIYRVESNTQV